jgi:hypothetical protein
MPYFSVFATAKRQKTDQSIFSVQIQFAGSLSEFHLGRPTKRSLLGKPNEIREHLQDFYPI